MVPNLGTEPRYSTVVGAQKPGHHRESIENPKGESSSWSPRPLFDIACSSCADDSAAALPAKRQRNHDLNIRESRYDRFWYRKPLRSPVVKLFFFNTTTEHEVSQGPITAARFWRGTGGAAGGVRWHIVSCFCAWPPLPYRSATTDGLQQRYLRLVSCVRLCDDELCVRCSKKVMSVRLFYPRSASGTGQLCRSSLAGSPFASA